MNLELIMEVIRASLPAWPPMLLPGEHLALLLGLNGERAPQ